MVRLLAVGAVMALAGLIAACQGSQPGARSFYDFKEDSVARDGVLSRCDKNPDASANDQECIAARRAAAAVALEQERSRTDRLEQQSKRKLVALRDRSARQEQAEEQAAHTAPADAQSAYDRQWRDPNAPRAAATPGSAPAYGAPLGRELPSMGDSPSADPYEIQFPGLPSFELGQVEPPSSEIEIEQPQLKPEDVAVVPARLHTAAN